MVECDVIIIAIAINTTQQPHSITQEKKMMIREKKKTRMETGKSDSREDLLRLYITQKPYFQFPMCPCVVSARCLRRHKLLFLLRSHSTALHKAISFMGVKDPEKLMGTNGYFSFFHNILISTGLGERKRENVRAIALVTRHAMTRPCI